LTCKAFRFPWSCRCANATRQIGEIMSYNAFIKQDAHGSESGNKAMSRTSMGCNLHGDRYGSPNYSVSYSRTQPLINIGISLAGFCDYLGVNVKKALILSTMIMALSLLLAVPVSQQTVIETAEAWMEAGSTTDYTVANYVVVQDNQLVPLLYKIDFAPDGFVVISADDSSTPILGYSTTGSVTGSSNLIFESMINDYRDQLITIRDLGLSNETTSIEWQNIIGGGIQTREAYSIPLNTQWNQGSPYNQYCPLHNGNRSYVGCVATASAQIINYFKYWDYSFQYANDSYYASNIGNIDQTATSNDYPNFSTLNSYMNTVAAKYSNGTNLNNNDIAALSFATGVLEHMQYGNTGSGTSTYNNGYEAFNALNYNCLRGIKSNFTITNWIDTISNQINANRPVQYRGTGANGGHSFIVFGYEDRTAGRYFRINWGWGGSADGYFLLTNLNPSGNDFSANQQMLYRIAPMVGLSQSIQLSDGSTDYSGFRLEAIDSDGTITTYISDTNGLFQTNIIKGTYDFEIYHVSNSFFPYQVFGRTLTLGDNNLSSSPIVLQARPTLVHVPAQASTIQEGIDMVADGGAVVVASGTYNVNELTWANKHVRLLGVNNPVLTNSGGEHAIKLDWSGINNIDRIHGFTFQNCLSADRGSAIALFEGASPKISNCTFDHNWVQGVYNMEFNNPHGFGGAVFIRGGLNQVNSPRFENCTFTNNAAANGNGGGAVALFGPASFLTCTFTDNWTTTAVGFDPPAYFAAGAILIYGDDHNGDILIHNCTFTDNIGQNRANDIWVAGTRGINKLTIDRNTFASSHYYSEPAIRLFYETILPNEVSPTDFIITNNKFNLSYKGAVYFHDFAGTCSMQFNRNVVNGENGSTYALKLHYYGGSPTNPDYFQFNNNTLLNLTSSGLVLFKGSDYTIENNIFHNCSPYDVEWGGHDGVPNYATESLTINNCFFNDLTNHVDTQGNAYQVFSISNPVVDSDPQLDSDYHPIWNASTMSPCIDSGVGTDDDETPADIGAYPTVGHAHEVYTMPTLGSPKWMSFPVLNRTTPDYDIAENFFAPIISNDILDKVIWKIGNNQQTFMYIEDEEVVNGNNPVQSVLGYKINLLPGVTQAIEIPSSGFVQSPNTIINLYAHPAGSSTGVNENWIGYFLPQSSSPFTALASILDKVTSIRTQYWSAIKGNGFWKVSSANLTLNYGDMVIITVTDDCSFAWGNEHPVDPKLRSIATAFEYEEKLDYTPMFIDLSGFDVLPSEIGLYVDGECKGAVKVEGNYTDLCAYLDKYEVINPEDCELVLYFDAKEVDNVKQRCRLDYSDMKLMSEFGIPHYEIAIKAETELNPIISKNALSPNYPNPFNPETTISYEIASDGIVKLDIFNLKGQLVKTLVNENKVSGPHKVVWNGTDKYGRKVASGIYQYRLTTKDGSITKKMMLMK